MQEDEVTPVREQQPQLPCNSPAFGSMMSTASGVTTRTASPNFSPANRSQPSPGGRKASVVSWAAGGGDLSKSPGTQPQMRPDGVRSPSLPSSPVGSDASGRRASRRGTLATLAFQQAMENQKYKLRAETEMEAITRDSEDIEGFLRRRNSWKEGCSHSIAEFASKIREACSMRKAAQRFLRGVGKEPVEQKPVEVTESQSIGSVLRQTLGKSAILDWVAKKEDDDGNHCGELYSVRTCTKAVLPSVVRATHQKRIERGQLIRRFRPGTPDNVLFVSQEEEEAGALRPRGAVRSLVTALHAVGASVAPASSVEQAAAAVAQQLPDLEPLLVQYGWNGETFAPGLTRGVAERFATDLKLSAPASAHYRQPTPLDATSAQSPASKYPQVLSPIRDHTQRSSARAVWERRRAQRGRGAMAHFPRHHDRVTVVKGPVDYAALLQDQSEMHKALADHDNAYLDMMDRFDRINYLNQRRLSRLLKPVGWVSPDGEPHEDEPAEPLELSGVGRE
eukprot:TRINITY_DN12208_c0_g1_i1.p1 TRINITY_DN12208_c0_g1~~TRINITY_DN12208_c0_g1_i1.p1  ORF type:complete len:507 (+),score=153.03 TRINITY_DN12208_c0_g1_i1:65-1585(+)